MKVLLPMETIELRKMDCVALMKPNNSTEQNANKEKHNVVLEFVGFCKCSHTFILKELMVAVKD